MNWILGLLLILIGVYLINRFFKKKKLAKTAEDINEKWGKPKGHQHINFHQVSQYFKSKNLDQAHQCIDKHTANDLDLNAVFNYLDRSSSRIGQQYLYYKLRVIQPEEKLKRFQKLTKLFNENLALRKEVQHLLIPLNSSDAYYLESLLHLKNHKDPKILRLLYSLSILAGLFIILSFFYPVFSLFLLPVFAINMVFHYRNKDQILYNLKGFKVLSKSLKIGHALAKRDQIQLFFKDFKFLNALQPLQSKMGYLAFESRYDNEFLAIFWVLSELVKILFNIEYIMFYRLASQIERKHQSIDQLFQFIGEVDTAISCASVRAGLRETCMPRFTDEKNINYKKITHPLVDDCVPNDLELKDHSVLLTGSNMSGKTTFIRTVALNALVGQSLGFCFAKTYKAPFVKILSSIRLSDDLLNHKSYYLEEALRIKKLVCSATQPAPCLFIMDELLKGTNTVERVAAGAAIVSYLNKNQNLVFVATHDLELTQLMEKERFKLFHFTETIENDKLHFDHKLKQGPLTTRNAIKILEINAYPEQLMQAARKNEHLLENAIDKY